MIEGLHNMLIEFPTGLLTSIQMPTCKRSFDFCCLGCHNLLSCFCNNLIHGQLSTDSEEAKQVSKPDLPFLLFCHFSKKVYDQLGPIVCVCEEPFELIVCLCWDPVEVIDI